MKKNNLSGMGRQRGASALTMMVMVLFFGGLLTLVIKLGPAYLDDITIQEALESLDGTEGLSQMGPAQVRTLINKRLSVNNVRGFDAKNISDICVGAGLPHYQDQASLNAMLIILEADDTARE